MARNRNKNNKRAQKPKIIGNTEAVSGKIDKQKMKTAKKIKTAALGGMGFGWNTFSGSGMNINYKNNSYSNMGQGTTAFGDVPLYIAMMNQNNGGILYWPITLKQKYSFYRYFFRTDAYVRSAVRLHSDLPMSKLVLRMPKMKDEKMRKKILYKYENMVKNLNLFDKLHSILMENAIIGNTFCFNEFSEQKKQWERIVILPPEEVTVSKFPMSNQSKIQYCPQVLDSLLKRFSIPIQSQEQYEQWLDRLDDEQKQVMQNIPYELTKQLIQNDGRLIMDTDPYCGDGEHKVGSFVYHFAESKHEYDDLGVSPLQCVLIPLLMREHYKYTQLNLASRNMTPRNKISAPGIGSEALEELREQIDMSMLNPDYSIVTNYDWNWEQIGAQNRLIDLGRQYENINDQLFAGLGVTKELLTGQGMYSGSKISIQILNTRYLLSRQMLQRYVEQSLFLPMAKQNDFYELDEYGHKIWVYPRLSFSRLTIRDNSQVFSSLFELYQKGSLPISYLYEVFNLDENQINEKLKSDMFTPRDATYNDLIRGIYSDITQKISQGTDLADQIIQTMTGPTGKKLKKIQPQGQGGQSYSEDFGGEGMTEEPQSDVTNIDELLDSIGEQGGEQNGQTETTAQSMNVDELLETYQEQQQSEVNNEQEVKEEE